jgi:hypothetical protein
MAPRRRRRRISRRHLQIAAVLFAIAAVLLGILVFAHQLDKSSPTAPPVAGVDGPGAGGSATGAGPSGTPSGSGTASSLLSIFPTQLTSKLGKNFRGLPGHNVVLTVSSAGSILRVGYLVPTADSGQVGDMHDVKGGFSRTFVARGPEGPYSAIFIQTDSAGTAVHCTVTVDGVPKDSQTISGRKKQGLCYG